MRPVSHILFSPLVGYVGFLATGSFMVALCAAVTTVAMDLDHLVDFFLFSPRPVALNRFLEPGNANTWKRLVFALHGYELMLFLTVISHLTGNAVMWGVTVGAWIHLLMDEYGNRRRHQQTVIPPAFYFFFLPSQPRICS